MAELILGPLLRYVGHADATVWVETDVACEVEVAGHRARTFQVAGHHYALVAIGGLEPGHSYEYAVSLDGAQRWPDPDSTFTPSRIRTLDAEGGLHIAFGSCRLAAPYDEPYVLARDEHPVGYGVDALRALAFRMRDQAPEGWPSLLLMLGDQVYADAGAPQTRAFIRSRRSTDEPPGEEVANFEEYTRLYREAWSDAAIRWLLSTLPSAMIFDDHEVIDDWNISAAWKREIVDQPWWEDRITGAFMAYWVYQHLGNLSPADLGNDELYARAHRVDDAAPLLRDFALTADRTTSGSRWSYHRELGRSRLVVIDSRAGRRLDGERREMLDDHEWQWLDGQLRGDVDHLLIATSLPFLLPRAIHDVERWNEAVCAGTWGAAAAKLGERVRRAIDLEHWAAFRASFERLAHILHEVAAGRRGSAPASIVILSGDVHYGYLAQAEFPGHPVDSRVYQAVCSPFRHPLEAALERANRMAFRRTVARIGRLLVSATRQRTSGLTWRIKFGPYFANQVAMLELRGRAACLRFEGTPDTEARLDRVAEERLS